MCFNRVPPRFAFGFVVSNPRLHLFIKRLGCRDKDTLRAQAFGKLQGAPAFSGPRAPENECAWHLALTRRCLLHRRNDESLVTNIPIGPARSDRLDLGPEPDAFRPMLIGVAKG